MYSGLLHAHSGFRWILLIVLAITFLITLTRWLSKSPSESGLKALSLTTLISAHLQLVIGLGLYFMSPRFNFSAADMKNEIARFFMLEHSLIMLIAIALITIGHSIGKKKSGIVRNKTLAIYYGVALVMILYMIPWPWQGFGVNWF